MATASRSTEEQPLTLTYQQCRIVNMIAEGKNTDAVAAALGVSRWTARDRIRKLCATLGGSMAELPALAEKHGCCDGYDWKAIEAYLGD